MKNNIERLLDRNNDFKINEHTIHFEPDVENGYTMIVYDSQGSSYGDDLVRDLCIEIANIREENERIRQLYVSHDVVQMLLEKIRELEETVIAIKLQGGDHI